jgi:hypothetical protein
VRTMKLEREPITVCSCPTGEMDMVDERVLDTGSSGLATVEVKNVDAYQLRSLTIQIDEDDADANGPVERRAGGMWMKGDEQLREWALGVAVLVRL